MKSKKLTSIFFFIDSDKQGGVGARSAISAVLEFVYFYRQNKAVSFYGGHFAAFVQKRNDSKCAVFCLERSLPISFLYRKISLYKGQCPKLRNVKQSEPYCETGAVPQFLGDCGGFQVFSLGK